jgi:hypothetical protein
MTLVLRGSNSQVGRNFEFALTVRDNVAVGGQTASDLMTLTATDAAGPFSFKPKQQYDLDTRR